MARVPDWLVYGGAVALVTSLAIAWRENVDAPPAPPAPDAVEAGALVGASTSIDPVTVVNAPAASLQPVSGTIFAVSEKGRWLTARHVVQGCRSAVILLGGGQAVRAAVSPRPSGAVALLSTEGAPAPLPMAVGRPMRIGQRAFTVGFPQGGPGEIAVRLLGRETLRVKGGAGGVIPVLAWAEVGRTEGLKGGVAGLSGAPMVDEQGRVVGVTLGEKPRRGRIYTTAPEGLGAVLRDITPGPDLATGLPITTENYGRMADTLRRDLRVARVTCLK